MSYSKLVSHVKLSPNCTKPRGKKIDTITIHYMAGDAKVEAVGNWFAKKSTQASSNYGIGADGRIACYVEEENRSWCSSNSANDNRAITIEVANYKDGSISDKAWESLINLCVDICKRYGFKLNFTGDKSGNLTMHKWFASTSCPGPWLEPRFPQIAAEVNQRLEEADGSVFYRVQVGAFKNKAFAEAALEKLKKAGFEGFITTVKIEAEKDPEHVEIEAEKDPEPVKEIKVGSIVRLNKGAKDYNGGSLASFVYERNYTVTEIRGDRVVITSKGVVMAAVKMSDLTLL